MSIKNLSDYLSERRYPGRGIVIGSSSDGRYAVIAYFIMGRSANSRNRIFTEAEGGIRTQAYDESKMEDPSLIIYHPVRVLEDRGLTIVTNGDQTDTIRDGILKGLNFEQALSSRTFEPDPPIFTPRISGLVELLDEGSFAYALNIIKSRDQKGQVADRHTFSYGDPRPGEGHIIHTYMEGQDHVPAFCGEPCLVGIPDSIDDFTDSIWGSLNEDNKVSLFVRFIDTKTGGTLTRIVNKYN